MATNGRANGVETMHTRIVAGLLFVLLAAGNCAADLPDGLKFDCHPEKNVSREVAEGNCAARGCTWSGDWDPASLTPACFYPDGYANYDLVHLRNNTIVLRKTDRPSGFPHDVQEVQVDISRETRGFSAIRPWTCLWRGRSLPWIRNEGST